MWNTSAEFLTNISCSSNITYISKYCTLRRWIYGHSLESHSTSFGMHENFYRKWLVSKERSVLTLSPRLLYLLLSGCCSTSTAHFSLTSLLSILFVFQNFLLKFFFFPPTVSYSRKIRAFIPELSFKVCTIIKGTMHLSLKLITPTLYLACLPF